MFSWWVLFWVHMSEGTFSHVVALIFFLFFFFLSLFCFLCYNHNRALFAHFVQYALHLCNKIFDVICKETKDCFPARTSRTSIMRATKWRKNLKLNKRCLSHCSYIGCYVHYRTLGKISAEDILKKFLFFYLSIFRRKLVLTFHANCLQ